MKISFVHTLLLLLFACHLSAVENYPSGARALGLSNAAVSLSDGWSSFNNQAGLAFLNSITAGVFYQSRFMVDELAFASGFVVVPVKNISFGFNFFQFGKGTFKENKLGISLAKKLSAKVAAGVQLDYLSQMMPENKRAKGFATFEAGIIAQPFNQIVVGAHVFNPVLGGINTAFGKIQTPAIFRVGGHYQFDENSFLIIEAQKSTAIPLVIKSGIEFCLAKNVTLRFGVSGKPIKYTAGFGFKTRKITTDIGFSYHGNLGVTPSVSIQCTL